MIRIILFLILLTPFQGFSQQTLDGLDTKEHSSESKAAVQEDED